MLRGSINCIVPSLGGAKVESGLVRMRFTGAEKGIHTFFRCPDMFTSVPETVLSYGSRKRPYGVEGWGITLRESVEAWFIVTLGPENLDESVLRHTLIVHDSAWLTALLNDVAPERIHKVIWMRNTDLEPTWGATDVREVLWEKPHRGRSKDRIILRTAMDRLYDPEGALINVTVDMFKASPHVQSLYLWQPLSPADRLRGGW